MKALILAAGYATRLYPLTLNHPKPLLQVGGMPIIEHILFRIGEVKDIDDVYVITNDRFYKHFVGWASTYKSKKKIRIINDCTKSNEDRLGAVGDIDFAVKKEKIDDDLLVIAGDNLFEFSLRHLNDFFKMKNGSIVGVYDVKDVEKIRKKLGSVIVDDSLKIISFEEKPDAPKSTLAATCCYLLAKKDVRLLERCINEGKKPDNAGEFIKWLSSKEQVYGFIFEEKWFDIGSHEQYREADEHFKKKR